MHRYHDHRYLEWRRLCADAERMTDEERARLVFVERDTARARAAQAVTNARSIRAALFDALVGAGAPVC